MFLKTNESILKQYLDLFHSNITQRYINLLDIIKSDKDPDTRKRANDELLILFDPRLSEFHRYVIRENNKEMIKKYENKKRKSGKRPYAIHPISVEYLLASLNLTPETLLAAGNHDNVEFEIAHQKKIGDTFFDALELFTNNRIAREYRKLAGVLKKAALRMKKNKASSPAEVTLHDKKMILRACIITQKVTRYESDKNYPLSIDKITDEDISISNQKFRLLFLEYLKDIKNDESITESYLDNFKDELTQSKEEIYNIIIDSFLVKLGDRISNSVDTYEKQSFSDKMTDLFKNFILTDLLRNYLRDNPYIRNYIDKSKYDALTLLSNLLIHVCNQRLTEERRHFDRENKNNESFHKCKIEKNMEEMIKKYAVNGGFRIVDPEVNDDVISGLIVSIFNKTLNKDASVKNFLDYDAMTQYRALESLKGIFQEYNDPDFTISNINIIRNYVSANKYK